MKILALDTSTAYLTVAILDGTKVLGRIHKKVDRNHSTLLIPVIDKVLKKCKLNIKDIDGFSVGVGPGSFTGLRIGIVTVKGLAYSLKKPIVAVPTFDAIAYNARAFKGIICPVLDARKNKIYACLYESDGKTVKRISEYLLIPAKSLTLKIRKYDKILLLGDGVSLVEGAKPGKADWYPRAEAIGLVASENFRKKKFVKAIDLEPMYLYSRECDITGI